MRAAPPFTAREGVNIESAADGVSVSGRMAEKLAPCAAHEPRGSSGAACARSEGEGR